MSSDHDRRLSPVAVLAALVALVAALACKDPPKPAAPPPGDAPSPVRVAPPVTVMTPTPAAPSTVTLDEPRQVLPRQEAFTLLDPGKGARAALRYALVAGTSSFHAATTLSSRHLENGAFTQPVALPAIRDGFAITTAADQPGTLALRGLTGEVAASNADAEAYLTRWRTLIQNRRITVAFDPRGAFSAIEFNDDPSGARSAQARDALVERLLSVIVPLPAEPVAVGASWRVITIFRQGPAYAKQTATYTLTARDARWKVHVKLSRVAKEQRLDDPSLPPGTTADLLAMFRALEGDVEVDPRYPIVIAGSVAIESRLHVVLRPPGPAGAAVERLVEDTGTVALSHQP